MILAVLVALLPSLDATTHHEIVSDVRWNDTDGNSVEAHGGCVLRSPLDGIWYLYGETRKGVSNRKTPPTVDYLTQGINCYSSASLAGPWRFEGKILRQQHVVVPGFRGPWIMQRPKVLFNPRTRQFVLWFHLDQPKQHYQSHRSSAVRSAYPMKSVGRATADRAAGPFTFAGSLLPDNHSSLDMSLFADPDEPARAYLLRDVDHKFIAISRLSDDFLHTTGVISKLCEPDPRRAGRQRNRDKCEAPAMFKLHGLHYVITSGQSGWASNPLTLWRSSGAAVEGARWTRLGNPAPTLSYTQPAYVVQHASPHGPHAAPRLMYMGDNWVHCQPPGALNAITHACYQWLPITLERGPQAGAMPVRIDARRSWDVTRARGAGLR